MSCFCCFSSPSADAATQNDAETSLSVVGNEPHPRLSASQALDTSQDVSTQRERRRTPPMIMGAAELSPQASSVMGAFDDVESPSVVLHVLDSRAQLKNAVLQARGLELSLFALDNGGLRVVDAQDFAPPTAREKLIEAFEESVRSSQHSGNKNDSERATGNPSPEIVPVAFSNESLYLRVLHTSPTLLASLGIPSISAYADILTESADKAAQDDAGLLSSLIDGSAFAALRGRTRVHKYEFPTYLPLQDGQGSSFQGMKLCIESGMWSGGLPVVIMRHQLAQELQPNIEKSTSIATSNIEVSFRGMQKTPDAESSRIDGERSSMPKRSEGPSSGPSSESHPAAHIASELPALLTLITMDGEVLYQNSCSKEFYGALMGRRSIRTRHSISATDNHDLGFWSDSLGRLLAASQAEDANISFDPLEPQLIPPVILEILNTIEVEGEWRGLVELIKPISGPFQHQKKTKKRTTPNLYPHPQVLDNVIEEPLLEEEAEAADSGVRQPSPPGDDSTSHLLSSAHEVHQAHLRIKGEHGSQGQGSHEINALFSSLVGGHQTETGSSAKLSNDYDLNRAVTSVDAHASTDNSSLSLSMSPPHQVPRRAPSFSSSTSNVKALSLSTLQGGMKKPPMRIMSLLNSSVGGFGTLLAKRDSPSQVRSKASWDEGSFPMERSNSRQPSDEPETSRDSLARPLSGDLRSNLGSAPGPPVVPRTQSIDLREAFNNLTEGLLSGAPDSIKKADETNDEPPIKPHHSVHHSDDEPSTSENINRTMTSNANKSRGSRDQGSAAVPVHTFVSGRRLSISMMTPFGTSMLAGEKQQTTVWHEMVAGRIPHPSGNGSVVILMQSDVTQRTRLEASIVELSEAQCSMLSSVFPRHIIEFLSLIKMESIPAHIAEVARTHEDVTIMFMDIVGFTSMSKEVNANQVMTLLNTLFTMFDKLAGAHKVHKVETAGDCYIVAGGILEPAEIDGFSDLTEHHDPVESARRVYAFARDMLRCSKEVKMPHNGETVSIRIGIHTGNCVSGLIGTKLPKFSVFGDTMNTASRMESTCPPGLVQVSQSTWDLLKVSEERQVDEFAATAGASDGSIRGGSGLVPGLLSEEEWRATGGVEVKGKGRLETYLWTPTDEFLQSSVNPAAFAKIVEVKRTPRDPRNPMASFVNNMINSAKIHGTSAAISSNRGGGHVEDGLMVMGHGNNPRRSTDDSGDTSLSNLLGSLRVGSGSNASSQVLPVPLRAHVLDLLSEQLQRANSNPILSPVRHAAYSPQFSLDGTTALHHTSSLGPSQFPPGSSAQGNEIGISMVLVQMCRLSMRGSNPGGYNSPVNSTHLPHFSSQWSGSGRHHPHRGVFASPLHPSRASASASREPSMSTNIHTVQEETRSHDLEAKEPDSDDEMLDLLTSQKSVKLAGL